MQKRIVSVLILVLVLCTPSAFPSAVEYGCGWFTCVRGIDTALCAQLVEGQPEPGETWQRASSCDGNYRQCIWVTGSGYQCHYDCNITDDCYSV
jgi:hypothetical protein